MTRDWVDVIISWALGLAIVAVIGAVLYGFYAAVTWLGEKRIEDHCSNIAWRVAKSAGTEAGRVADVACRQEAGQAK
jgi:hypothetical protein